VVNAGVQVDHGADVNLVDRTGASPLHYAALFGQKKEKAGEKEKEKEDPLCMVALFLQKVPILMREIQFLIKLSNTGRVCGYSNRRRTISSSLCRNRGLRSIREGLDRAWCGCERYRL